MNISDGRRDAVIYIPMYTTSTGDLGGMNIILSDCDMTHVATPNETVIPHVYVWEQYVATASMRSQDRMAQPVDWAYKSAHVGLDDAARLKSRGLYSRMQSHGDGVDKLDSNWLYGTYNTLASADEKGWTSQIID